jgi:hypothetical protein
MYVGWALDVPLGLDIPIKLLAFLTALGLSCKCMELVLDIFGLPLGYRSWDGPLTCLWVLNLPLGPGFLCLDGVL